MTRGGGGVGRALALVAAMVVVCAASDDRPVVQQLQHNSPVKHPIAQKAHPMGLHAQPTGRPYATSNAGLHGRIRALEEARIHRLSANQDQLIHAAIRSDNHGGNAVAPASQAVGSRAISSPPTLLSSFSVLSPLTISSVAQLVLVTAIVAGLSYAAVSPRTLPTELYNAQFQGNFLRACIPLLTAGATLASMLAVLPASIDVNNVIHLFAFSFTVGYWLVFVLEIALATVLKLGVLRWLEPKAFELCPTVPGIQLPWALAGHGYLPRRSSLLLSAVLTSVVMAPIVEEAAKLVIFRSNRYGRPPAVQQPSTTDTQSSPGTHSRAPFVREYLIYMAAISTGLKAADAVRRILVYTGAMDSYKTYFAVMRSLFPIRELCGALTATLLAGSDLFGDGGWLKAVGVLLPAVGFHAMANFRGMKPIYVWESKHPWNEILLQSFNGPQESSFWLTFKRLGDLLWLSALGRALLYVVRQSGYYSRKYVVDTHQEHTTLSTKHPAPTQPH